MIGCSGHCTFSKNRINVLQCEEKCKDGYIETKKGVCESCKVINPGCSKCRYQNNYQNDYSGFKRLRNVICDECEDGYFKSEEGKCLNCKEVGVPNCNKCKKNGNSIDYICEQCWS